MVEIMQAIKFFGFFTLVGTCVLINVGAVSFAQEQIIDLQGDSWNTKLKQIDTNGVVQGENIPEGTRVDQLSQIETPRKASSAKTLPAIWTVGGGRIYAESVTTDTTAVTAVLNGTQWRIPVEDVRAIVFSSEISDQTVDQSVEASKSGSDRVFAMTSSGSQSVDGELKSVGEDKLLFVYNSSERTISRDKVQAVIFADYGLKPVSGTSALVKLINGSTIHCAIVNLIDGQLTIKLPSGSEKQFDWNNVSSVNIQSDRVQFLSNLQPIEQQHQPLVTVEQPWTRNSSVQGNPIQLRVEKDKPARQFSNGIGMHSYSQLVFANEKECNRLMAVVGIDIETEGRGDCRVAVTGDGVELWSQEITGNDFAINVDVDITGAEKIGLVVYPGKHLDLADHVDWAMVRILKTDE
jgi:hypothetical protein